MIAAGNVIINILSEFGYLPLLNGNSNEASGGKYGIDECVKRLINLSETGHKLTSVQKVHNAIQQRP